jgi:glycosyltransferase involved in cell wall biosynthesis
MISVCLTTYNGAKYIKEQLASILEQLSVNDEVVISDDKSSDNTIEVINSINDKRIKIHENKVNVGYTKNFENALSYAKGDIIFLSDQDDIWCKNKVEIYLQYFNDYDFIVSDAVIINEQKDVLYNSFFEIRKPKKTIMGNILKFGYLGCLMAFKKEILTKALPFPKNNMLCTHDNWLFLIGCVFFKYKIINDKLVLYRRHKENVSSGGLKKTTSIYFKIKYRLYLIYNIICRLKKV